jgi:hypothetical protein
VDGSAQRWLDFNQLAHSGAIFPGAQWNFQFWMGDAGGVSTSNGMSVQFQP